MVSACLVLLWRHQPTTRAVVVAGALVGYAGLVRGSAASCWWCSSSRCCACGCRGSSWWRSWSPLSCHWSPTRPVYMVAHGQFALGLSGPRFLYARLAPYVACDRAELPSYERSLCPKEPVGKRPDTDYYMWGGGRGPAYQASRRAGMTKRVIKEFDKRDDPAQPLTYARRRPRRTQPEASRRAARTTCPAIRRRTGSSRATTGAWTRSRPAAALRRPSTASAPSPRRRPPSSPATGRVAAHPRPVDGGAPAHRRRPPASGWDEACFSGVRVAVGPARRLLRGGRCSPRRGSRASPGATSSRRSRCCRWPAPSRLAALVPGRHRATAVARASASAARPVGRSDRRAGGRGDRPGSRRPWRTGSVCSSCWQSWRGWSQGACAPAGRVVRLVRRRHGRGHRRASWHRRDVDPASWPAGARPAKRTPGGRLRDAGRQRGERVASLPWAGA